MFKVGKKYMVSKRKFISNIGETESVDLWVKSLVGIPFVVTQDMLDEYRCNTSEYYPNTTVSVYSPVADISYSVCSDWCIPIK